MQRTFSELYRAEACPAMSHPTADPAVNVRVARKAGLEAPDPAAARILEIGCGTGHHILSVANRWPTASCTGLEISRRSVSRAANLARQAGVGNVEFRTGTVLEIEPEEPYDVIVAHGVFSWVADEVKLGLMDFIGKNLSASGVAVVGFNVVAGWRERMAVVEKIRAIQAVGGVDEMTALSVFMTVAEGREKSIAEEMLAKGAELLAFDDFAPVMDAWSLGAMLKLAQQSGLDWLGDSVSGEKGDDKSDQQEQKIFRSELFCRADAAKGEKELAVVSPPARSHRVPDFPKLDGWRLVCAREALPLVDADLKPCLFPFDQIKVLAAMDGSLSVMALADYAKEVSPSLDFIPWLRYVAERGFFDS